MNITSVKDLGAYIRRRRKELGYTQRELAEFCNCGERFLSELERGKETVQLGKAIQVVSMLGIDLKAETRR